MKIGAIGYYTQHDHKDFEIIKFSGSETLLEFDMLIININGIFEEYGYDGDYQGVAQLTKYSSKQIKEDFERRAKEIKEMLESGKNILLISPIDDYRSRYTGRQEINGTGRSSKTINIVDYIHTKEILPIKVETTKATGKAIEMVDKKMKKLFDKYQDNLVYYSFTEDDKCKNKLIKIKATSKIVAWYENIGKGIALFFPDQDFSMLEENAASRKEKEFLNDIYNFMYELNETKTSTLPEWTKSYRTDEEKNKIKDIKKNENEIIKLEKKNTKDLSQLSSLEDEKRIFTTDSTELENIVKNIFIGIGLQVIKAGGNEEDLVLTDGTNHLVLEVKGTDGSATEKHTSQTVKWRENYFIDTDIKAKGVLVVNAFKSKELDKRQETFPNQLLKSAEHQDLCLMSSIQLYNIYKEYMNGNLNKEDIVNSIINQKGIYDKYDDWSLYIKKD